MSHDLVGVGHGQVGGSEAVLILLPWLSSARVLSLCLLQAGDSPVSVTSQVRRRGTFVAWGSGL